MITLPIDAIILCALATWRLSYMLAYETGPNAIFETLRYHAGANESECQSQRGSDRVTNVLCCLNCLSIWIAIVIVPLWLAFPPAVYVLALSALAIFIQKAVNR